MAEDKEGPARQQWARVQDEHRTDFDRAKSPVPARAAAFVLWLVALVCEVACVLLVAGKIDVPVLSGLPWLVALVGVAVCLALTLAGQRMWKKAGAVKPAKHQAVIGVAMASAGFVVWALFFCASKNLPVQSKVAGAVCALAAVACCAVGCVALP